MTTVGTGLVLHAVATAPAPPKAVSATGPDPPTVGNGIAPDPVGGANATAPVRAGDGNVTVLALAPMNVTDLGRANAPRSTSITGIFILSLFFLVNLRNLQNLN